MKYLAIVCLAAGLFSTLTPQMSFAERTEGIGESSEEDSSTLHTVLCYLPNRLFDLLDVFRARVRVGPGLAAGVRVTDVASAFVGSYASVYAGLPGPRGRSLPILPVGLESHNGATVSVVDATVDGGIGPDYGSTEIGAGAQLGIIGLDLGFDPLELADFLAGVVTLDIQDDDF
jgi:hypothetical protein